MTESTNPSRPPHSVAQYVGVFWVLAYGLGMQIFTLASADPRDIINFETGILLIWAPVACITIALWRLRGGEVLALILLALASLMSAQKADGDMKGAPQAIAILMVFIGAPFVLLRGFYVTRRRRSSAQQESS